MTEEADGTAEVSERLPIVDYLQIGDDPHLVANECTDCGARYFDRRNACAKCGRTAFTNVRVAGEALSLIHI